MILFDLTLETPGENVALDEALLDEAEAGGEPRECLRLWESPEPVVVLGRSSQASLEVDLSACRRRNVTVLRRASGGAAIVAGPGCLMYALVLSYRARPELRSLDAAHRFVLDSIADSLGSLVPGIARRGTSDLAIGDLKFSGNSVRCKRNTLLYHGTILYDFDLSLVDALLPMPPRQPDYRLGRPHRAFVANLPASREALRDALVNGWQAEATASDWPRERTRELVERRDATDEWNLQREKGGAAIKLADSRREPLPKSRNATAYGECLQLPGRPPLCQSPLLPQIPLGADQTHEQQKEGPGVPRSLLDQRLDFHLDRLFLNPPQQIGQFLRRERHSANILGHRRETRQQRGIGHGIVELQILFEHEKSRLRAANRRAPLDAP